MIVDIVIFVDEAIAKADDSPIVSDASGSFRIGSLTPEKRLANDFKIALDRLADVPVALVVVQARSDDVFGDVRAAGGDIIKPLRGL